MKGLNLFIGNRLEILAEKLAAHLDRPLFHPLAQEIIVVQSKGMERWLSMQLASFSGICANVRFPFPRHMIRDFFKAVLTEWDGEEAFDPEHAAWRIMELLPSCSPLPGFEPLEAYLSHDSQGLKCYQLSGKLADLYDQYLIFRPEMILNWEKGILKSDEEAWQAGLWNLLIKGKPIHAAALRQAFQRTLAQQRSGFPGLPERVSLFGVSYLPPFYLETFLAISPYLEVNFFLLNPSREFWFDIRSSKEIAHELKRAENHPLKNGNDEEFIDQELYLEEGNSLLASLGTLGREFWSFLSGFSSHEEELYVDPGSDFLLASIQSDILNLKERGGESCPVDRSIRIHACHSPMREVEVLFDSILDLLDGDPTLQPQDILVMAPDIETYALFIPAVFDPVDEEIQSLNNPPRVPYHIADRTLRSGNAILNGFLAILDLPLGRFTANEVLSLLEIAAIRDRFALTETDVDKISRWVAECGIRWGIDEHSRLREGLPGIAANSWLWGLERLLLGYALPARENELFCGILPCETDEGNETRLLGVLATFAEQLSRAAESMHSDRTLSEWGAFLEDLLKTFFLGDEDSEPALRMLHELCPELKVLQEKTGFNRKVSLAVLRSRLDDHFKKTGADSGFLSRGVTFCSLLPMRSIPARVICLLGMNNADYPRRPSSPGFDLLARHPRRGDRSRRNDDRYLFLEALLSARDTFYISYVGQSIVDNSRIPPSVVVSELLDYIRQGKAPEEKDEADSPVISHPLQAFSPSCFDGGSPHLFSYSAENSRAAAALQNRQSGCSAARREEERLPEADIETSVTVRDLISFFHHPVKYMLERRLGVQLSESAAGMEENEPFNLEGLSLYRVEQLLMEKEINTGNLEEAYPLLAAQGSLPHGAVGQYRFSQVGGEIRSFVHHYGKILQSDVRLDAEIDLEAAGFRISGSLEGLRSRGLVHYRYAKLKGWDHLRLWIMHLLQAASATGGPPWESLLLGKDGAYAYSTVDNAAGRLEELLTLYKEGLSRPLHFFPESSWAYAKKMMKKGDPAEVLKRAAMEEARRIWDGSSYLRGEGGNDYRRLCFTDLDPLDVEFQDLSLKIYEPLLEAQRKEKPEP